MWAIARAVGRPVAYVALAVVLAAQGAAGALVLGSTRTGRSLGIRVVAAFVALAALGQVAADLLNR